VALGEPLAEARRQQQLLITIARQKVLATTHLDSRTTQSSRPGRSTQPVMRHPPRGAEPLNRRHSPAASTPRRQPRLARRRPLATHRRLAHAANRRDLHRPRR
jgi:hypothetical protein